MSSLPLSGQLMRKAVRGLKQKLDAASLIGVTKMILLMEADYNKLEVYERKGIEPFYISNILDAFDVLFPPI